MRNDFDGGVMGCIGQSLRENESCLFVECIIVG